MKVEEKAVSPRKEHKKKKKPVEIDWKAPVTPSDLPKINRESIKKEFGKLDNPSLQVFKTFQALMILLKGKQVNWELIRQNINNSLNKDLDEFSEGK